jgi:hypothetical protein
VNSSAVTAVAATSMRRRIGTSSLCLCDGGIGWAPSNAG